MLNTLKSQKGFSLVESLVAVLLVAIVLIGTIKLITSFAMFTATDTDRTCLLQAASSGIEAKRADPTITSLQVTCGINNSSLPVSVTISGNPPANPPPMGSNQTACAEITATATFKGKTMTLRDWICNFPEG